MNPASTGRQGTSQVLVVVAAPLDPEAPGIGGIATFVRGFVKYAPPDFDVAIVGVARTARLGVWRSVTLDGREVRHLPVARPRTSQSRVPVSASFTLGLMRHARRIPRGGLLQFHRPATSLPLLGRRDPKVHVVHATGTSLVGPASESRWRRFARPLRLVERLTLGRMNRVYVVNEAGADAYREAFPRLADRIVYLPNWVDDAIFRPPDSKARARIRREVRTQLGTVAQAAIVLYAARLESVKDPILAVRGAVTAMTGNPRLHLLICGDGALRCAAEREAADSGFRDRVSFIGHVSREALARLMAAADCLLITSHHETGPTVGLEALATGLPVVTTRVGTVAALIARSGAGAVVESRSPEALASSLTAIVDADVAVVRDAAISAVEPHHALRILPGLYDDTRALASAARVGRQR